ncbi:hypothetical protein BH686_28475 [Rhodococcus erythropolis]|nr:hypothetical protein BH686_28475 [Rhodococcus erythropolis]
MAVGSRRQTTRAGPRASRPILETSDQIVCRAQAASLWMHYERDQLRNPLVLFERPDKVTASETDDYVRIVQRAQSLVVG